MERKITVGYWYIVGGPAGATVTVKGEVNPCCTVPEGGQGSFYAQAPVVVVSDEAITLSQVVNFKCAPVKRWLLGLGRGVQTLPAGCIPVEFLTFTQKCYIDTDYLPQRGYSAKMTLLYPDLPPASQCYLFGGIAAGRLNIVALHGEWEKFVYYAEDYMTMHFATDEGWGFESNKKYEFTINDIANKREKTPNKSIVFNAQDIAYWAGHTSYNGEFAETFKVGGANVTWGNASTVRHFAWTFFNPSGEVELELIPALDTQRGEACLCDVKRHKVYYKGANLAGRVVPGFTLAQARNLSKLPATGGNLTVSLPWEAQLIASGVPAILQAAADRGWTITVQYREPEADSEYYNRYAECVTVADMLAVNPDYQNDLTADGEWIYPLPNLRDGGYLFKNSAIKHINFYAPKLIGGCRILNDCYSLLTVEANMPNFISGSGEWDSGLFICGNVCLTKCIIHAISEKTSTLTYFAKACRSLTEFSIPELPKLSSITNGFDGTQLNKVSILKLLNQLPTWTSGDHLATIGIHVDNQTDADVLAAIADAEVKGWSLTVQWNGTASAQTASTFGLRRPTIYAKLGTVARPDGTTENALDWGHYVSDWEANGYREFGSVEEAKEYFNLIDEA